MQFPDFEAQVFILWYDFPMLAFMLFTLVIYEPNEDTFEIDVYDYTKEAKIYIVCPEGVYDSECIEPKEEERKETISLEDIQACADNTDFF